MKPTFLLTALAFSMTMNAQVQKVNLKASGLTCSMCSNAINKALKTLDFVESVEADIKTYRFEISFKQNCIVDFDKIKNKVEGAGFSIIEFTASVNFDNIRLSGNNPVTIGNSTFLFINKETRLLNGLTEIKILGKGFISPGERRKINYPNPSPGIYLATI